MSPSRTRSRRSGGSTSARTTTIVDAYLKPVVAQLVDRFEQGLAERGFGGSVSVLKSNGGQVDASAAVERSAEVILSGLAGGIVAGRYYGELAGERDLVTLDMGGTSADVGMVRDGADRLRPGLRARVRPADRTPRDRPASPSEPAEGRSPGSTTADCSASGPRSAGAVPGPICYGLGGEDVTVTDANLVLGRLDPELLPRRAHAPRPRAPRGRCRRRSARGSASAPTRPRRRWSSSRRRGWRTRSAGRGRAGRRPARLPARRLRRRRAAPRLRRSPPRSGMKGVIVPPHPGLASAFGTLRRRPARRPPVRRTTSRSDAVDLAALNAPARHDDGRRSSRRSRAKGFGGEPAVVALAQHALRRPELRDATYPLRPGRSTTAGLDAAPRRVPRRATSAAFGYSFPDETVELIHCRTSPAVGAGDTAASGRRSRRRSSRSRAALREVSLRRAGRAADADLPAGRPAGGLRCSSGPAVVEELDSTTLCSPGPAAALVGPDGILRLSRPASDAAPARRRAIDSVTMSVVNDHLVNVAQEMGTHMMRDVVLADLQRVARLLVRALQRERRDDRAGVVLPGAPRRDRPDRRLHARRARPDVARAGRRRCSTTTRSGAAATCRSTRCCSRSSTTGELRRLRRGRSATWPRSARSRSARSRHGDRGLPGGPATAARPSRRRREASRRRLEDHPREPPHAPATRGATCTR